MHKTIAEARVWTRQVASLVRGLQRTEVVVFPPHPSLLAVAEEVGGAPLGLGGQDAFWETEGAFTGMVSPLMLADAGCSHVLVAHSERRLLAAESDREAGLKLHAALDVGLTPVYCVGETMEDHDRRETAVALRRQYGVAFRGCTAEEVARTVIAYEPVWAIGSGRAALPEEAAEAAAAIRGGLQELYGEQVSRSVRILYGGSVSVDNADGYLRQQGVDGLLIGGASLDPVYFGRLLQVADAL